MTSKAHALSRDALIRTLTAYSGITTADGAADGTTLIDSNLIGRNNFITEKTILIMSGAAKDEDKGAIDFDNTDGKITLQGNGFLSQIVAGTIFRVLNISSIEIDVAAIDAKIGTNTDAAGRTTLFAWLLKLFEHGGLVYYGEVTQVDLDTQFRVAGLAGFGDAYFANTYRVYVVRDAAGLGAAPQGEMQPCTAYTSVGGIFTQPTFTVGLAVSDEVLLIHERIAEIANLVAGLGTRADTAHVTFPSAVASALAYLKGQQIAQGLCYYGDITTYTDTTHIASTTLGGFETGFFIGWACFLIKDDGGAGASPQGARSLVTAFTTGTGAITLASPLPAAGAVGDQIMLVHPVLMDAWNARGGVETLESIDDELDAVLDVARGKYTKTMTGGEDDLYGESSDVEFCLLEFRVDLHNMAEGDTIVFRVYTTEDGTERKISDDAANTFTGAQDPARVEIVGSGNQVWGREDISVTAEQTAGTNQEIICYWRDAKRGG